MQGTSTKVLDTDVRARLDSATRAELQRIAAAEDRSEGAVIRRAIRFYLDARRKGLI